MVIVKLSKVSFVQYWTLSGCLLLQHNYSLLLLCLSFLVCKMGVAGNKNRKHMSVFACGAFKSFPSKKISGIVCLAVALPLLCRQGSSSLEKASGKWSQYWDSWWQGEDGRVDAGGEGGEWVKSWVEGMLSWVAGCSASGAGVLLEIDTENSRDGREKN